MESAEILYKEFIDFCSSVLVGENPKILDLIQHRYNDCQDGFCQSLDMVDLLTQTKRKMEEDTSRLFVHLKEFTDVLKSKGKNKKKSSGERKRKRPGQNGTSVETAQVDYGPERAQLNVCEDSMKSVNESDVCGSSSSSTKDDSGPFESNEAKRRKIQSCVLGDGQIKAAEIIRATKDGETVCIETDIEAKRASGEKTNDTGSSLLKSAQRHSLHNLTNDSTHCNSKEDNPSPSNEASSCITGTSESESSLPPHSNVSISSKSIVVKENSSNNCEAQAKNTSLRSVSVVTVNDSDAIITVTPPLKISQSVSSHLANVKHGAEEVCDVENVKPNVGKPEQSVPHKLKLKNHRKNVEEEPLLSIREDGGADFVGNEGPCNNSKSQSLDVSNDERTCMKDGVDDGDGSSRDDNDEICKTVESPIEAVAARNTENNSSVSLLGNQDSDKDVGEDRASKANSITVDSTITPVLTHDTGNINSPTPVPETHDSDKDSVQDRTTSTDSIATPVLTHDTEISSSASLPETHGPDKDATKGASSIEVRSIALSTITPLSTLDPDKCSSMPLQDNHDSGEDISEANSPAHTAVTPESVVVNGNLSCQSNNSNLSEKIDEIDDFQSKSDLDDTNDTGKGSGETMTVENDVNTERDPGDKCKRRVPLITLHDCSELQTSFLGSLSLASKLKGVSQTTDKPRGSKVLSSHKVAEKEREITSSSCTKDTDANADEEYDSANEFTSAETEKFRRVVEEAKAKGKKPPSERHIRKLESLLEKLRDEIEKGREMTLDDMDEEDSFYIYEEKLKKKFVAAWSKLCEITNRTVTTGRPTERSIRFSGTRYREINRRLEKFLNKKKQFPDFEDVKTVIKMTNKKCNLHLSAQMQNDVAREAFVDIGEMLQTRRHQDFVASFGSRQIDSFSTYGDPALTDPELRRKLDKNRKIGRSNLEAVINKYTELQYKRGTTAKDDGSDDDDDIDDTEDDGKKSKHKEKTRRKHKEKYRRKEFPKSKRSSSSSSSEEEEEERREEKSSRLDTYTGKDKSRYSPRDEQQPEEEIEEERDNPSPLTTSDNSNAVIPRKGPNLKYTKRKSSPLSPDAVDSENDEDKIEDEEDDDNSGSTPLAPSAPQHDASSRMTIFSNPESEDETSESDDDEENGGDFGDSGRNKNDDNEDDDDLDVLIVGSASNSDEDQSSRCPSPASVISLGSLSDDDDDDKHTKNPDQVKQELLMDDKSSSLQICKVEEIVSLKDGTFDTNPQFNPVVVSSCSLANHDDDEQGNDDNTNTGFGDCQTVSSMDEEGISSLVPVSMEAAHTTPEKKKTTGMDTAVQDEIIILDTPEKASSSIGDCCPGDRESSSAVAEGGNSASSSEMQQQQKDEDNGKCVGDEEEGKQQKASDNSSSVQSNGERESTAGQDGGDLHSTDTADAEENSDNNNDDDDCMIMSEGPKEGSRSSILTPSSSSSKAETVQEEEEGNKGESSSSVESGKEGGEKVPLVNECLSPGRKETAENDVVVGSKEKKHDDDGDNGDSTKAKKKKGEEVLVEGSDDVIVLSEMHESAKIVEKDDEKCEKVRNETNENGDAGVVESKEEKGKGGDGKSFCVDNEECGGSKKIKNGGEVLVERSDDVIALSGTQESMKNVTKEAEADGGDCGRRVEDDGRTNRKGGEVLVEDSDDDVVLVTPRESVKNVAKDVECGDGAIAAECGENDEEEEGGVVMDCDAVVEDNSADKGCDSVGINSKKSESVVEVLERQVQRETVDIVVEDDDDEVQDSRIDEEVTDCDIGGKGSVGEPGTDGGESDGRTVDKVGDLKQAGDCDALVEVDGGKDGGGTEEIVSEGSHDESMFGTVGEIEILDVRGSVQEGEKGTESDEKTDSGENDNKNEKTDSGETDGENNKIDNHENNDKTDNGKYDNENTKTDNDENDGDIDKAVSGKDGGQEEDGVIVVESREEEEEADVIEKVGESFRALISESELPIDERDKTLITVQSDDEEDDNNDDDDNVRHDLINEENGGDGKTETQEGCSSNTIFKNCEKTVVLEDVKERVGTNANENVSKGTIAPSEIIDIDAEVENCEKTVVLEDVKKRVGTNANESVSKGTIAPSEIIDIDAEVENCEKTVVLEDAKKRVGTNANENVSKGTVAPSEIIDIDAEVENCEKTVVLEDVKERVGTNANEKDSKGTSMPSEIIDIDTEEENVPQKDGASAKEQGRDLLSEIGLGVGIMKSNEVTKSSQDCVGGRGVENSEEWTVSGSQDFEVYMDRMDDGDDEEDVFNSIARLCNSIIKDGDDTNQGDAESNLSWKAKTDYSSLETSSQCRKRRRRNSDSNKKGVSPCVRIFVADEGEIITKLSDDADDEPKRKMIKSELSSSTDGFAPSDVTMNVVKAEKNAARQTPKVADYLRSKSEEGQLEEDLMKGASDAKGSSRPKRKAGRSVSNDDYDHSDGDGRVSSKRIKKEIAIDSDAEIVRVDSVPESMKNVKVNLQRLSEIDIKVEKLRIKMVVDCETERRSPPPLASRSPSPHSTPSFPCEIKIPSVPVSLISVASGKIASSSSKGTQINQHTNSTMLRLGPRPQILAPPSSSSSLPSKNNSAIHKMLPNRPVSRGVNNTFSGPKSKTTKGVNWDLIYASLPPAPKQMGPQLIHPPPSSSSASSFPPYRAVKPAPTSGSHLRLPSRPQIVGGSHSTASSGCSAVSSQQDQEYRKVPAYTTPQTKGGHVVPLNLGESAHQHGQILIPPPPPLKRAPLNQTRVGGSGSIVRNTAASYRSPNSISRPPALTGRPNTNNNNSNNKSVNGIRITNCRTDNRNYINNDNDRSIRSSTAAKTSFPNQNPKASLGPRVPIPRITTNSAHSEIIPSRQQQTFSHSPNSNPARNNHHGHRHPPQPASSPRTRTSTSLSPSLSSTFSDITADLVPLKVKNQQRGITVPTKSHHNQQQQQPQQPQQNRQQQHGGRVSVHQMTQQRNKFVSAQQKKMDGLVMVLDDDDSDKEDDDSNKKNNHTPKQHQSVAGKASSSSSPSSPRLVSNPNSTSTPSTPASSSSSLRSGSLRSAGTVSSPHSAPPPPSARIINNNSTVSSSASPSSPLTGKRGSNKPAIATRNPGVAQKGVACKAPVSKKSGGVIVLSDSE